MLALFGLLQFFAFVVEVFEIFKFFVDTEALPRCQANDLKPVCVFWTLFELVDQLGHLAVRPCAENNLLQFWLCLSRFSNFSELFPLFFLIRIVSNAKLPLL